MGPQEQEMKRARTSFVTRETKLELLAKLLCDPRRVAEVRNKIQTGEGITLSKGEHFEIDVLKEALQKWDNEHGGKQINADSEPRFEDLEYEKAKMLVASGLTVDIVEALRYIHDAGGDQDRAARMLMSA